MAGGKIVFATTEEGGQFKHIQLPIRGKPAKIIKAIRADCLPVIIVFPCGMIWDSYLPDYLGTKWRHKLDGGRRGGKKDYKLLLKQRIYNQKLGALSQ